MNRRYRWQFHFNAMHSFNPEKEEEQHPHSFLVIVYMEIKEIDLDKQNACYDAIKRYLKLYNGLYLNELNKFVGKIPTLEVICSVLYKDTQKIAEIFGLEQVRMEVGDSPTTLFCMGKVME